MGKVVGANLSALFGLRVMRISSHLNFCTVCLFFSDIKLSALEGISTMSKLLLSVSSDHMLPNGHNPAVLVLRYSPRKPSSPFGQHLARARPS